MSEQLIATIGIFIGELYGNFVGGGSIVTQFFLQGILDIPIKQAIAWDNAAVLGSELGLFLTLWYKNRLEKWMGVLAASGVAGSILGLYILNIIDAGLLKIVFTGVIVAVLAHIFFSKSKPKQEQPVKTDNWHLLIAIGFSIGAYNAFLSIGDYVIGLLLLTSVIGLKYTRALFGLSFMLVFARCFAAVGYFQLDYLDWSFVVPMFTSATAAGIIVGTLMNKYNFDWMEKVLKFVGLSLGLYLIYSLF
ncbi:MAG: sulfite exporter TauE/SafE family protein [Nitratireductor sp.]